MKSKLSVALIAMMFCIAFAGSAFAQTVETFKTNRNIEELSTCGKAGALGFRYQEGIFVTAGDQTFMSLPANVSLCKGIDWVFAPAAATYFVVNSVDEDVFWGTGTGFTNSNLTSSPSNSVYVSSLSGGTVDSNEADDELIFHLMGSEGGSSLTMTVFGAETGDYLTADDSGEKIEISMFDGRGTNVWMLTSTATDATSTIKYYTTQLAAESESYVNALCLDISTFSGSEVKLTLDSANVDGETPYTFDSDPVVANVVTAGDSNFTLSGAEKEGVSLELPGSAEQDGGSSLCDFDFDAGLTAETLNCNTDADDNNLTVTHTSTFDDAITYVLTMTVLVNGSTNDGGVYWGGVDPLDADFSSSSTHSATTDRTPEELIFADGADACSEDEALATSSSCGTLDCENQIGTLEYELSPSSDVKYLHLNLPNLIADGDKVAEGDVVTISLTIGEAPCGSNSLGTLTVGTFVTSCSSGSSATLIFPYFPEANFFFNGLALVNLGSSEATFSCQLIDTAENCVEWTNAVPARGIFADLIAEDTLSWTACDGVTLDDTFGTNRFFVECTVPAGKDDVSGLGFFTAGDGSGTNSMGYLPEEI